MPVINGSEVITQSTAGTTLRAGTWYSIPSNFGNPAWQAILTASSVGATAGSTITIEVSNSTQVAISTIAQTIALTCTTDTVSAGGTLYGTTMLAAWRFIRANIASLTTSTAGSAGSPAVRVIVSVQKLG
jgi:hypothetical protein